MTQAVHCQRRFIRPKLDSMLRYAITDRFLLGKGDTGRLIERCGALAQTGIDFILVREKDLPAGELVQLCRQIAAAAQGSATQILVSSRVDVALAAGVAGVHLSSQPGELTPAQVRQLMPSAFISVSCHSLEEIRRARLGGASAALFAPVFGKTIQGQEVSAAIGLDALRAACAEAAPMPVFALGGVTNENAASCGAAGAAGIAGIRIFYAA
ncbi:thiamine monophosphate synthase [Granulicella tundricola MP5ACTX9]|uniref:Thiamine monophosphate synthase n=2 Tax=Granulicella TaxID=940557 RepID=E8X3Z1_GRATM|nr:thiamine monophosphate synthase [Granulicella tundricola MP5ACTX9]